MPGIDIDGGGLDMFPEQARPGIEALVKVAADIRAMLDRRITEIAGLDNQLGKGQAGARFYLSYQPFVDAVIPQMRELIASTEAHGANGLACVDQYVQQDLENRGIVQSVNSGS